MKFSGILSMFLLTIVMVACKKEGKTAKDQDNKGTEGYVKISGKIKNAKADTLYIGGGLGYSKKILIKNDSFSGTLTIPKAGTYYLFDRAVVRSVYLKKGFDLKINVDDSNPENSVTYTGEGADFNNFILMLESYVSDRLNEGDFFGLDEKGIEKGVQAIKKGVHDLSKKYDKLGPDFIKEQNQYFDKIIERFKTRLETTKTVIEQNNGKSPVFTDYENIDGSKTSLKDLQGKYVYIDIWATWCGPCVYEIPYLKKLEEDYKGKNIQFVSISVDKDRSKWEKMIKEKKLKGIQLLANNVDSSQFMKDYKITGIPRFILLDSKGKIISADTHRPSREKKIRRLFEKVGVGSKSL